MSGVLPHQRPIAPNTIEDERAGAVTRRTVLTAPPPPRRLRLSAHSRHAGARPQRRREFPGGHGSFCAAFERPDRNRPRANWRPDSLALRPSNPPTVPPPPIDLSKSMPGSDPVDVKREYLTWANEKYPSGLETCCGSSEKISTRPRESRRSDHCCIAIR